MMHSAADDVREAVHLTLELQLGIETVVDDSHLFEDLGADSFDLMNVVAILEKDHEIAISETAAASVDTVGDLVSLVESLKRS